MIENLVIVESPAKAKTIERFLGENYVVKSSFGHKMCIRDRYCGHPKFTRRNAREIIKRNFSIKNVT